jgi:hypothetical protein
VFALVIDSSHRCRHDSAIENMAQQGYSLMACTTRLFAAQVIASRQSLRPLVLGGGSLRNKRNIR